MGKSIELMAKKRGHEIVAIIDKDNPNDSLNNADVAINFSTPFSAVQNIKHALKHNVAVVCGTTGWLENLNEVEKSCIENGGGFLYASNFSLGVNLFFSLNKKFAKIMSNYDQYKPSIEEVHHTEKIDTPSGTAITLAEEVLAYNNLKTWELVGNHSKDNLPIKSKRQAKIPGTHSLTYESEIDLIRIEHIAKNRDGFSLGAVIAAEWINGKSGIFNMNDVLNIN